MQLRGFREIHAERNGHGQLFAGSRIRRDGPGKTRQQHMVTGFRGSQHRLQSGFRVRSDQFHRTPFTERSHNSATASPEQNQQDGCDEIPHHAFGASYHESITGNAVLSEVIRNGLLSETAETAE